MPPKKKDKKDEGPPPTEEELLAMAQAEALKVRLHFARPPVLGLRPASDSPVAPASEGRI